LLLISINQSQKLLALKKQTKFFKLFAACIPVLGYNRSIICDLEGGELYYIPNDLCKVLLNHEDVKISKIKRIYNYKFDDTIDEYFEYLSQLNLGFFTDSPQLFPKMDKSWYSPFKISNAIIDIDNFRFPYVTKILDQLDSLYCKYIQIRFFGENEYKNLIELISYLDKTKSTIFSVQFIIKYDIDISLAKIEKFLENYSRVVSVIVYSSPKNKLINVESLERKYIFYSKQNTINETACGNISESLFSVNIENFTESLKFNSCLNKKISIDTRGNIKNCPSFSQSFGNIEGTTLEEAVSHKDFRKYWHITKDQIEVCKDCEFRYVCTDCRAYRENPNNLYSKPLKCGYDPYTNKWEDWSTNPLKQKAIKNYSLEEV